MALRWAGAAVIEAAKVFRRLQAYEYPQALRTALLAHQANIVYIANLDPIRNAAYRHYPAPSAIQFLTSTGTAIGCFDTDMMTEYTDDREELESHFPASRSVRPEKIGGIVAYLMSLPAGYLAGNTITMDGGLPVSTRLLR